MTAVSEKIRLEFDKLPLVEAAVLSSFDFSVPLTFQLINDVAKHLRDEFHSLEEPKQFEVAPGVEGKFEFGPNQIAGALFAGNSKGLCVTLQGQVIVVRWQKQSAPDAPDYPRFPALSNALWETVSALRAARKDTKRPVLVLNMSYVNFLKLPHSSPVLARYFSDEVQVKATAKAKQVHKVELSWRDQGNTDFRFTIEQVTAQAGEEKVEGYRLTTAAGRRFSPAEAAETERDMLDQIHNRLQVFFRDLLSDEAKKEWLLREVPIE